MEQKTGRQRWIQAVCNLEQGARVNQLLSIMSGGEIAYVQWLYPLLQDSYAMPEDQQSFFQAQLAAEQVDSVWPAQAMQWQSAGLLHTRSGQTGLLVVAAYAAQEDFNQEELQMQLSWLQQMKQHNDFPVRLLLLGFSKVPDSGAAEPELESWQWEELLESGVQMAIGQQAMLEEVTILPLVSYEDWLRKLDELEAAE